MKDEGTDEDDQQRFRMTDHVVGNGGEIADHPKNAEIHTERHETTEENQCDGLRIGEFVQIAQWFKER